MVFCHVLDNVRDVERRCGLSMGKKGSFGGVQNTPNAGTHVRLGLFERGEAIVFGMPPRPGSRRTPWRHGGDNIPLPSSGSR
jgi:hypothetical protein